MSRIVAIADTHFGASNHLGRVNPQTGLHSRLEDFLKNFDTVMDYVLSNKTDLFVIAGDIYKTRSPSNTEQEEFAKRIAKLGKVGQRTLILTGNHDMWASRGSAHTVAVINALRPNAVDIVDEPRIVDVNGLKIGAIPYLYRQRLGVKTNDEVLVQYKQQLDSFREQGVKLLIGHQTIEGAKMPAGYVSMDQFTEVIVPQSYLVGFDCCIFGHIHEHQVVCSSPLTMYTGPLERIDFSQSSKPVGFIIYDTDIKRYKFQELQAVDLYYVKVDLTDGLGDLTKRVLDSIDMARVPNSIMTISISIRETDVVKINRAELEKVLSTAKFSAGVRLDIERSHISRDKQVNETMSAEEALLRYIQSRSDLKDIADTLLRRGTEVIKIHDSGEKDGEA